MRRRGVLALTVLLVSAQSAQAQRLPVRHYGLSEGLPHNAVLKIYQDRKGFLWIGTFEGLARYDGDRFVTYSTVDGLGHDFVNDIAEDRQGRLWIATNGGGIALLTQGSPSFRSFPVGSTPLANAVNAIAFDGDNALWAATDEGLYRAPDPAAAPPAFERVVAIGDADVSDVFVDTRARVWVWLPESGLRRLDAPRQTWIASKLPPSRRVNVTEDRQGRLFLAGDGGIFELAEPASGEVSAEDLWRPMALGGERVTATRAVLHDSRNHVWISTASGLIRYDGTTLRKYAADDGLPADPSRLFEDRDGNVWIVTSASGLYRVLPTTIATITGVDRRLLGGVQSLFEGIDGRVYARLTSDRVVEVTETQATSPGQPLPPRAQWSGRRMFRGRAGDWWVLGTGTLCQFAGPRFDPARPERCLDLSPAISWPVTQATDTTDIPDLYEDPQGRVWFGDRERLWHLTMASDGSWNALAAPIELPPSRFPLAPALADRSGSIWLFSVDHVVRVSGGRAAVIDGGEAAAVRQPRSTFVDRQGRLWIGTRYSGVAMTAEPEASQPRFVRYTTKEGLSSNAVWSITQDNQGRIYLGTGRGLDRLDPATGHVRHFTTADGLAGDIVNQCLTDRRGAIWVATPTGLSRLLPADADRPAPPPVTYLSRIQIAGEEMPVPETGIQEAPPLVLPASRNSVLLQYIAPSFRGEHRLLYQYRLDGLDSDWSAPTEERAVNYARLTPGSYRFSVRAIDGEGETPGPAATLSIEILPPIWRRGWFLAMAAVVLAALLFGAHRLRLRRLLAMEALRRQIATDLHDDIGAGLAQVAILSEVVRRQAPATAGGHLTEIATLARSMRDSMSDIVWAIDPRKDRLTHLVQRMRQFAIASLAGDDVRVEFHAPEEAALAQLALTPDRRRHLLLILKEAVTNIARHARASRVVIDLGVANGEIRLRIEDDGRGFDPAAVAHGHGLSNLQSRSRALGGELTIDAAPGRGSRLDVHIPRR